MLYKVSIMCSSSWNDRTNSSNPMNIDDLIENRLTGLTNNDLMESPEKLSLYISELIIENVTQLSKVCIDVEAAVWTPLEGGTMKKEPYTRYAHLESQRKEADQIHHRLESEISNIRV